MSFVGGELSSTPSDAFRWERALETGRLLSAASLARFTTLSIPLPCRSTPGVAVIDCRGSVTGGGTSEGTDVWIANHQPLTAMPAGDAGFATYDSYILHSKFTLILLVNYFGTSWDLYPTIITQIAG